MLSGAEKTPDAERKKAITYPGGIEGGHSCLDPISPIPAR